MQKTAKRILSIVLVLAMALSLGVTASAANDDVYVEVGQTVNVYAPFGGSAHDFQWVSRDESIAYVTPIGDGWQAQVTGISAGSTMLTVYASASDDEGNTEYLTEYISIVVTQAARPVTIRLSSTSLALEEGDSDLLFAEAENFSGKIRWSSSNPSVASVDKYGGVTALSEGRTTITARADDASAECIVTVTASRREPLHADTRPQSIVMQEGETETLTALPSGGDGNYSYLWYADDESVVTLSGSGKKVSLKAVGGGTARVILVLTDGAGNYDEASCSVRVNAKARPTSTTYSYDGTTSVGGSLDMASVASAMEKKFRSDLGETLGYDATVYLYNPSNSVGHFTHNGQNLSSGTHQFAIFQSMVFEPYTAGTFSTGYEIKQGDMQITGTITITVTGGVGITSATMDAASLEMSTYSNNYLSLYVAPRNANYSVRWTSSNNGVASVTGNGLTGSVMSYGPGSAIVTATVTDSNGKTLTASCTVYVRSAAQYNPTLTVTLGSDYYGTDTSDSMARQFRDVFGVSLNYKNAMISFSNTGDSRIGVLRTANGRSIYANTNYSFSEWANNIWFEPVSAGTFSVPYTLSYNNNTLTGTFSIIIRGSSVSARLSSTSLSLATYSNQDLDLTVTPANSRYSVQWLTSNSKIATVSGTNYMGRVETKGTAGTVTITARVTDAYGASVDKQCTVTVMNSATYSPSVSTYIGVAYTGTGTSDAMVKQFHDIYGGSVMDVNKATIRFSSTGNNNVGVLRLKNGAAVQANTDYTMAEYIKMYTEPVSTGTFVIPYTLTYNGNLLIGNVNVVINGVNINSALELANTDAYSFSSAAANGEAGSTSLGNSITNTIGSSWQYVRFGIVSGANVGTLYRNASRAAIDSANINKSDFSSLYFVPAGTNGTYSIAFTVYNANGGTMSTGTLSITVKGAAAAAISFADVDPNNPNQKWVVEPVRWAVSKGITNGMGNDAAGRPLFAPNTTCNKAQILTFLWRAQGSPAPTISNPFSDVKSSDYFYNAALWAYEKGIISGTTFGEATPCTRAMAVTYMWILAGRPSMPAADFGDVPSGGETASAVAWAFANGIANGMGNDATGRPTFQPETTCTRGQIVTFLQRAYG